MDETLKENENYRVRIVEDDSGEKPYDEGSVPILSREFRGYYGTRWVAFNSQADPYTHKLNELAGRIQRENEEEVIERYLRIFHNAYSVTWDSSENNRYVAFDTAAWRESVGITDGWANTEGSLSEVMAWANGEVYGYVLERKTYWTKTYTDADGQPISDVDFELGNDWEEIDSCYGFYGWDSVKEAAEEAFQRYMP